MSTVAAETAAIVERLPEDKARELLDYAGFLAERADDEEWERITSDVVLRPKFIAFLQEVDAGIAAGRTEELDESRL